MKFARALRLALAFSLPLAARGLAEEKLSPMRNVGAYAAIDGVEIVENSPEDACHLRVVGGDSRRTKADQEQLWIAAGEYMYQMLIISPEQILPGGVKQPDERTLLSAHAAWECNDHNEALHAQQTAKPEFQLVGARTWCHWTYDLTPLAKLRPQKAGDGPGPQTQHFLTTVVGHKIVVLVGTTLVGQKDETVQAGLLAAAGTLAVLPQPLTQSQIEDLCSKKQP